MVVSDVAADVGAPTYHFEGFVVEALEGVKGRAEGNAVGSAPAARRVGSGVADEYDIGVCGLVVVPSDVEPAGRVVGVEG